MLQMVTDSLRYWVARDARRRLPLRSRDDSRRASRTASTGRRLPRQLPAGPGADAGEADRRAMGYRSRRLSGRSVPARLGGMERQVPRYVRALLEGRRRQGAGLAARVTGVRRHFQPARTQALGERQFHHRARRLHAERPRLLQRQAQRGERRRQSRRALATICPGTAASRARRKIPTSTRCASARSATCSRRCSCRRARRCCLRATSSATPNTATTTPTARTTRPDVARLAGPTPKKTAR